MSSFVTRWREQREILQAWEADVHPPPFRSNNLFSITKQMHWPSSALVREQFAHLDRLQHQLAEADLLPLR